MIISEVRDVLILTKTFSYVLRVVSANSDLELVMKGVINSAIDYLLKPVWKEKLLNIWQHVVCRKKLQPKYHETRECGKVAASSSLD